MTAEPSVRGLGPVGRRLLAAFVLVSLVSLLVLIGLSVWGVGEGLRARERTEYQRTARTVATAAADAYRGAGGWAGADLDAARSVAHAGGGRLSVFDASGTQVAGLPSGTPAGPGLSASSSIPTAGAPVLVDGREVGRVEVAFVADVPFFVTSRTLVSGWVVAAAAVGLVAAVVVGWLVSSRMLRPLRRLTASATRFARGDQAARAGHHDLPGELGQLSRAVDAMADAVVAEQESRRSVVADIAHELRSPLTTLQAGLEELQDGLEPPTPARLAVLHDESLRLSRILDDLSQLAVAESSPMQLSSRPCDLRDIVADAVRARESRAHVAAVTMVTDLTPAPVVGDPDRLHQVVANLLENALRYSGPGARVMARTSTSDGMAVLEVDDTGPGIPAADLPHVVERHYRGGNAASVGGSGLGLTVANALVEAHGGTLLVAAGPGGGGTRVVVRLPARAPVGSPRAADADGGGGGI